MSRVYLAIYLLAVAILLLASENRSVTAREELGNALPAALLEQHKRFPDCYDLSEIPLKKEEASFRARLDSETQLFGIVCEPSNYNWPFAIYLVRGDSYDDAERVYFADYALHSGWSGSAVLYNARFDRKSGLLEGFSMSSQRADCGSKTKLKWDGDTLAMVEFRFKDECDGDFESPFPLLYKRAFIGKN